MINEQRIVESFMNYVRIDSESHFEKEMTLKLVEELESMGFEVYTDKAGEKTDSNGANVYCFIDGDEAFEPILFSSHMDTVKPGNGIIPYIKDGYIYSQAETVLGADDKSGIAAIVEAVRTIKDNNLSHRSIELVFTIREEGGCHGSANLEYDRIVSKHGIVLDASYDVGRIVINAPGQYRIYADIYGKPSHAGSDPEKGVSAIMAAARAVNNMKLLRIDEETTANIGTFSGIGETNVVNDHVTFTAEARSLDQEKLEKQAKHMISCIEEACDFYGARVEMNSYQSYIGYKLPKDHPHVKLICDKCEELGIKPWLTYSGGNSDSNNFNSHGITTAVLACGMEFEHTNNERIAIKNLVDVSELVLRLMMA